MFVVGKILFQLSSIVTGLVMYATLVDCDPFTLGVAKKVDQVNSNSIP